MYEDVQLLPLNIYAGSQFRWVRPLVDEAGDPLSSTDGWTGECQVRSQYGGTLVVGFGATHDGTCAFDVDGNVTLELAAADSATLPPTQRTNGLSDGRYVADLEVWQTSDPDTRYRVCDFLVRVFREATV